MRIFLTLVLVVILGVVVGITTAALRLGSCGWDGDFRGDAAIVPRASQPGAGVAHLVVDQREFNFGTMDADATGTHDFTFTNTGDGALTLSVGETSCRCTMSELGQSEVPPGQSTKVTMTWEAEETIGPYRQTATIFTNDAAWPRVTLSVSGRITAAVRAVPGELVFSSVSAGQPATAEAAIFCYLEEPLEILGFKLAESDTAEQFEVGFRPLSEEQIAGEPEARSGKILSVTVKPGLPQGPFRQKILIRTNQEASPALVVPIEGAVGSDIAVVGRNYDSKTGVLSLGTVSGRTGTQRRLMLVVRGPHRKQVKFTPAEITPDLLKVEFGKAAGINNDTITQIPMIVRIPAGSRPANHLGSKQGKLGEILLETNHPQAPKLRILVSFAVEG